MKELARTLTGPKSGLCYRFGDRTIHTSLSIISIYLTCCQDIDAKDRQIDYDRFHAKGDVRQSIKEEIARSRRARMVRHACESSLCITYYTVSRHILVKASHALPHEPFASAIVPAAAKAELNEQHTTGTRPASTSSHPSPPPSRQPALQGDSLRPPQGTGRDPHHHNPSASLSTSHSSLALAKKTEGAYPPHIPAGDGQERYGPEWRKLKKVWEAFKSVFDGHIRYGSEKYAAEILKEFDLEVFILACEKEEEERRKRDVTGPS
ncbi:hypothetical protein IAT38_004125 [Cryptococcus sp. DSM 104549]